MGSCDKMKFLILLAALAFLASAEPDVEALTTQTRIRCRKIYQIPPHSRPKELAKSNIRDEIYFVARGDTVAEVEGGINVSDSEKTPEKIYENTEPYTDAKGDFTPAVSAVADKDQYQYEHHGFETAEGTSMKPAVFKQSNRLTAYMHDNMDAFALFALRNIFFVLLHLKCGFKLEKIWNFPWNFHLARIFLLGSAVFRFVKGPKAWNQFFGLLYFSIYILFQLFHGLS